MHRRIHGRRRASGSNSSHRVELLERRQLLSVTTVNAATAVAGATSNLTGLQGVNLAYWDDQQNTTQTQQMVEAAGLNEFRFPGGSASDEFHFNIADNFGDPAANTLPQFAQFIQAVGGTGIATLDYGEGSPQEAVAEIAYLLGSPSDTTVIGSGPEWIESDDGGSASWQTVNWNTVGYWAGLRAAKPLNDGDALDFLRINQSAPFSGIKSFEIGNEEYGSWETDDHGTGGVAGAPNDPATYALFCSQLASAVRADAALPAVQFGIDSGGPTSGDYNNWIGSVLTDGLADGFVPNFISDHNYMQDPGNESDSFLLNDTVSDPATDLDWTTRYADYETVLKQTLGTTDAATVSVWGTEFNSVSYDPGKQTTSLVNGLFIADSLGSMMESGYSGGYVWDLRNDYDNTNNDSTSLYGWRDAGDYGLLGDPNVSDPPATGAYIGYPSYYAEQLFSKIAQTGGTVVSSSTSSTGLSVYAVKEANGHLDFLVINKSPTSSVTNQFNISGFQPAGSAQVWQYGETQDTAQSQSSTGASALASSTATLTLTGSDLSYTFPKYSMTVLDVGSAALALSGSNYLRLDSVVAGQLDVWSGSTPIGLPTATYALNQYGSITDAGTAGNDTLTIDLTNGNPLAVATPGISFDTTGASGGTDALVIVGDNHGDTYNASTGQLLVSGGTGSSAFSAVPIHFASVASLVIQAGTGPDVLAVTGTTPVQFIAPAGAVHPTAIVASLSIGSGAKVAFASPSASRALLELGTATNWAGQLDLGSNDMLVHGGAAALATVNALVATGYGRGSWTGVGIASSAADNAAHLTALGVILNNQAGTPVFNAGNLFDGVAPLTNDVLVKYTWYGDANLSGTVDGSDYSLIDGGYAGHGALTGWFNGDSNYDGVVDGSDYALIDNAFNNQGTAIPAAVATIETARPAGGVAAVKKPKAAAFRFFSNNAVPASLWDDADHRRRKHATPDGLPRGN